MDAHGTKSMPEWMQDEVHVAKDAPARSQSSRSTPAPTGVESIEAFKAQMRENDRREAAERGESNARSELRGEARSVACERAQARSADTSRTGTNSGDDSAESDSKL